MQLFVTIVVLVISLTGDQFKTHTDFVLCKMGGGGFILRAKFLCG